MSKKIIIFLVAFILIIVAVIGIAYTTKRNSSKGENTNKSSNQKIQENNTKNETKEENNKTEENGSKEEDKNPHTGNKVLIAYFSRADENYNVGAVDIGNTEIMAGYIKEFFGDNADTFKIEPIKAYPKNYKECTEVATKEKSSNARPEIKNKISNFEQYDIIFVGYPIWYGEVPMIINTFLERYNFTGKTIIPFNTHEGSGDSGTYTYIKNKMTTSDVNTNGLAITGQKTREASSKETVFDWINELGF